MGLGLFDEIHNVMYDTSRHTPATIEEFMDFGLTPTDYTNYVGLQLQLQARLLLSGLPKAKGEISSQDGSAGMCSPAKMLLDFCAEKNLTSDLFSNTGDGMFWELTGVEMPAIAKTFYDWYEYPRDPEKFRLDVERKLSAFWDPDWAYREENYDGIDFTYDDTYINDEGVSFADIDSPLRVRKYDPISKSFQILNRDKVFEIYTKADSELKSLERKINAHKLKIPAEETSASISKWSDWINTMLELEKQYELAENFFDSISSATETRDLYRFTDRDELHVINDFDRCSRENHLLFERRAELSFYGKPDKIISLRRCGDCTMWQITLDGLHELFEKYGVPTCKISYDTIPDGGLSDFDDASVFSRMGYTVSQSVGLSADERQSILKLAISSRNATKKEVLDFLRRRIQINGAKEGNEIACSKWKQDYEFIRNLE